MAGGLAILMHGFGSNGDDLAGLAARWAPDLPDVRFSSPNAAERSPHRAGYQWFALEGITDETRPHRVAQARAGFDRIMTRVLQQQQMTDQLDKVVLVGFSQGAIMVLDAVVSGRWPVAGVVAFSGRLASPAPLQPAIAPLLLIHGMIDPVIPFSESEKAARQLREAGYPVITQFEPSTGHTISAAGARATAGFIAERLS
ncbi:phospholipase [Erwinia sp. OLTSP20]|uniref:alpha/beta hydrolase n=1 Tax=unclassified Erwinia TaxID=2622719 RepID=UPI000C187271|nr:MULTISPECIES: prolyl oligopeptidase family serine peptidase [unclassified Erwinia]PIJ50442.1 phospholipase [Erwinia sp. OAMSP11]PIJ72513.1 phospholipase [Erwinia sp. OLSSP12]PIJ81751.1 phospholipase [Erwinia sp. OLCASP19]PIJ84344.1 phospholipase [Erwinia sp. OLMTSP26]PIJ86208.1 phospholipase [Erwinia sp. OLMDSP33]